MPRGFIPGAIPRVGRQWTQAEWGQPTPTPPPPPGGEVLPFTGYTNLWPEETGWTQPPTTPPQAQPPTPPTGWGEQGYPPMPGEPPEGFQWEWGTRRRSVPMTRGEVTYVLQQSLMPGETVTDKMISQALASGSYVKDVVEEGWVPKRIAATTEVSAERLAWDIERWNAERADAAKAAAAKAQAPQYDWIEGWDEATKRPYKVMIVISPDQTIQYLDVSEDVNALQTFTKPGGIKEFGQRVYGKPQPPTAKERRLVPATRPPQTPGGWGITGYQDLETGDFIPTGQTEPKPKFEGGRTTKPIGKTDAWGNEYVQDYEIDKWTGKEIPIGNPYPRYTEAPAGLAAYRGPRGAPMSAMDVERMRAASEGAPSENMSPGSIAARQGAISQGYTGFQNVPGVSPGDWQALMTAQREEQAVGAAAGGLENEKFMNQVLGNATRLWPTLSLPERAALADVLKGMGFSMPGQQKYISFGGGTQAPAPALGQGLISQKPTGWSVGSAGWGAVRQG